MYAWPTSNLRWNDQNEQDNADTFLWFFLHADCHCYYDYMLFATFYHSSPMLITDHSRLLVGSITIKIKMNKSAKNLMNANK